MLQTPTYLWGEGGYTHAALGIQNWGTDAGGIDRALCQRPGLWAGFVTHLKFAISDKSFFRTFMVMGSKCPVEGGRPTGAHDHLANGPKAEAMARTVDDTETTS
jgi:hypothetical protein